jgi:organic radical activating enzyme
MMKGERPSECDYCWNIEDLSHGEVSDRFIKSAAPYSIEEFKKITENPFSPKQIPRYVEISFSNKCQFKCSYCSSDYSSTWMDEIEKFGKYSTDSGTPTKKIYTEEENPYVKAFWDWWPELKTNLHTLRVTGGEPLLSPSTFKLMEALNQEPNRKLSLSINSNLGAPAVLIDKFVKLAVETEKNKAVKKLDVYTSIDAWGPRAEYIRNGLKHDYFWDNVEKLLGSTQEMRVYIMCTFNAMSLTSFLPLLKKVREINIKYRNRQRVFPLDIDFAYLRYPEYQSVKVLPSRYQSYIEEIIQHLEQNQWLKTEEKIGFLDYHVLKMKRILEWMRQDWPPETLFSQRVRFYEFFKEHDRRRNTNFLETFPEMEDFWTGCKQLYEIKNR